MQKMPQMMTACACAPALGADGPVIAREVIAVVAVVAA